MDVPGRAVNPALIKAEGPVYSLLYLEEEGEGK